ncbi:MAG: CHASE3 domain-containing protein [Bacteroidales bacterium]|nr:CHASE3 domain-containing protein [Bacteroidales bacterium]
MELKFRTQLLTPNVLALSLMLIIAIVVYASINSLLKNSRWVQHTHEVIGEANGLMAYMIDQETGMRGFAVSGNEEFLEPYNQGSEKFQEQMKALQQIVNDNPVQVSRLQTIENDANAWKNEVAEKYITMRRDIKNGENTRNELFALIESGIGKKNMDNLRAKVSSSRLSQEAQNQIILDMVNMETGLRGFLLNSKEEYLEPYHLGKESIEKTLSKYNVNRNISNAAYGWINDYAEKAISINTEAMKNIDMKELYAEFNKKEGKKFMDKIRAEMNTFIETEQTLLVERNKDANSNARLSKMLLIILTSIAIILSLSIVIVLSRRIMKQLGGEPTEVAEIARRMTSGDLTIDTDNLNNKTGILRDMFLMVNKLKDVILNIKTGAESINIASREMNTSSQLIAQGANEQASSVEEVSSSMEQMVANIEQNSDSAITTEKIALNAASEIKEGSDATNTAVTSMKNIADKIRIINDIAFQTNILALNAAVEAARAGEHGKGFAVVATEVRKLAEHSKVAAEEIDGLSRSGVDIAEQAGKALTSIVPEIEKTSQLIQEIASASTEQKAGTDQINQALQQLNNVTQQNSASSEELASSAEELSSQAQQLNDITMFFDLGNNNQQVSQNTNDKIKVSLPNGNTTAKKSPALSKKFLMDDLSSEQEAFESF